MICSKQPGNEGTNNRVRRRRPQQQQQQQPQQPQHDKNVLRMTYVASSMVVPKSGFRMSENPTLKLDQIGATGNPATLPDVYSCKAMMGLINTITAATIQSLKCEVIQSRYARSLPLRFMHVVHSTLSCLNVQVDTCYLKICKITPMRTHMYQMNPNDWSWLGPWLSYCISVSFAGLQWWRSTGKTLLHLPCLSHLIMISNYILSSSSSNMWNHLNLKEHSM